MHSRVILAGLLGGFVLFLWGTLSHTLLGLGDAGMKAIPSEQMVLSTMKSVMPEPGFYFFPWMDVPKNATDQQKMDSVNSFEQRYRSGPYGILIYHPNGTTPLSPAKLAVEIALNLAQGLILAILVAISGLKKFQPKVWFVVLAGILAAITTNVEYWNWYGFPGVYTSSYIFDKIVGFLIVGLVIGVVTKDRTSVPLAA